MYKPERESYYRHLLSIYNKYIPSDMIQGWLKGEPIAIEIETRMVYDVNGQAVLQFRH